MRRALENGEFQLHYQPVLGLASRRVEGVEALLRWRDPERGVVLPAAFIPIAEETGLIREVGNWVLRTAVAELASWRSTPLDGLRVAINVSAAQLEGAEFAAEIERLVAGAGIEPRTLALEITESLLPSDSAKAGALLERIAALGVRIALDDFGIGFSSLSSLHQLPIHVVKLDRSFACSLSSDSRSSQIVGAVVAMAHGLGLVATMEGVETEEQAEIARELGCDEIQGYWVGVPVPARDLPRVISEIERGAHSKPAEPPPS
jgi:EAL domain-containing protein (putative c-di-GMP-specific phosphodiesterase class I)